MLLHPVDDFAGSMYSLFGAADYQVRLTGSNLDTKGLTQKTKVTIGRPKQLKLITPRV
jgi:hypothetical protein